MKCTNCGGELLFQNGIYLCKSCGSTSTLDSVYENVDVYICYEENDVTGRRTRDSIIAQEVYRKLEDNKVSAFYERISADGLAGADLEASKLAAIHRAKIIIVLGTSIENFETIEAKYSEYFAGKPVIPFCVDVKPGAIPKSLSKIQAMSYSTIGWDKDLLKGVYNILGRDQTVDTSSLYKRRKVRLLAICGIIIAVAIIAVVVGLLFQSNSTNEDENSTPPVTEEKVEVTEETNSPTTKPLTQNEIYDNANELLNQGDLIGALELFSQIPDHPNSANALKLIYAKYEGYYQSGDTTFYLNVSNNESADAKLTILDGERIVYFTDTKEIVIGSINFEGIDNFHRTIQMEVTLTNDGLDVQLVIDSNESTAPIFFPLSEKSDQPILQISKDTFLGWLKQTYTISKIRELGYNLVTRTDLYHDTGAICSIENFDIEIVLIFLPNESGELALCGASIPAEYIAPDMIGKKALPNCTNDVICWPNSCYDTSMYAGVGFINLDDLSFAGDSVYTKDKTVAADTLIGVALKENDFFDEETWGILIEEAMGTTDLGYYIKVPEGTNAYYQPSYNSEISSSFSETFSERKMKIVNEQVDAEGKIWGQIYWMESLWICVSDIQS